MKKSKLVEAPTPLSPEEQVMLASAEEIISVHDRATSREIGRQLAEIRDRRLYRTQAPTFEKYVRLRFDLGRARAYQLIRFSEIVALVSTEVDIVPTNERQIRPLLTLADDDIIVKAWDHAVRSCANTRAITAREVVQAVGFFVPARLMWKPQKKKLALPRNPAHLAKLVKGRGSRYVEQLVTHLRDEVAFIPQGVVIPPADIAVGRILIEEGISNEKAQH